IPEEVEEVVLTALAKVPADRFRSAGDFAQALQEASEVARQQRHTTASRRATTARGTIYDRRGGKRGAARGVRRPLLIGAGALAAVAVALAAWLLWLQPRGAVANAAEGGLRPQRIAVTYFEDMSPAGHLGYLADGLTESLIDQLGQVKALDVVSKDGVGQFRGKSVPVDSIARALQAGTVVRGTVEQDGRALHVSVRLVDGNSGVDLLRKSFDQPSSNMLAIRDSLAQEVAHFLRERVGEEVALREQRRGTQSAAAWELLQRAERMRKDAESRIDADSVAAGLGLYRQADTLLSRAESLDPRWADPAVLRGRIEYRESRVETNQAEQARLIQSGLAHAEHALQLDPRNARALELRGTLRYWRYLLRLDPNPADAASLLAGAEEDLRAAVAAEPTLAVAWSVLSHLYAQKSELVESKLAAQRAYEEDAYLAGAPDVLWRLFVTSLDLQQFRDADRWCGEGARRFPADAQFARCQLLLMAAAPDATTPDVGKAWKLVDSIVERTPAPERPFEERAARMWTAAVMARAGLADSARRVLVAARGNDAVDPNQELLGVEAYAREVLGDRDAAIRLVQTYLAEHPDHRAGLAESQSWQWRTLREDPRFREMVGATR
ncbi:MAG TPA: hypothetical protein VFS05_07440, partial [Gemmatimonadaceae bacterium]|nr:hypothetical protein [Gemmatimonadaceae bacterium]